MPKLHSIGLTIDVLEQATIKAALIHWRNLEIRPEDLEYLAGNCGEFTLLDDGQLECLIERVSLGD